MILYVMNVQNLSSSNVLYSLLQRVHEVVKQCQDFKTSSSQKDKKIDELTAENTTLAFQVRFSSLCVVLLETLFRFCRLMCLCFHQVRNAFTQLTRAEDQIAKLTLAHEMSRSVWKDKREYLEKELNEAVTHRVNHFNTCLVLSTFRKIDNTICITQNIKCEKGGNV